MKRKKIHGVHTGPLGGVLKPFCGVGVALEITRDDTAVTCGNCLRVMREPA